MAVKRERFWAITKTTDGEIWQEEIDPRDLQVGPLNYVALHVKIITGVDQSKLDLAPGETLIDIIQELQVDPNEGRKKKK